MVNVAGDSVKLQLTSVVIHKEVFCTFGPTDSRKGIRYVRSFRRVYGASSGRATEIVVRGFSIRHYEGAGLANIPVAGSPSVDNPRFPGIRDSGWLLTPRICGVPMVRTRFGG
jgi:hypothetical protein